MTEMQHGELFLASKTDRIVKGLLLPWNELSRLSRTSKPVKFARGTLRVPRDVSHLNANLDHDSTEPLARFVEVEDTPRGLVAAFAIADTDEGDELIRDVEKKELSKFGRLSAEVKNLIRRGEDAVSGDLFGAAFVGEGAFKSAALFAIGDVVEEPAEPTEPEDTVEKYVEEITGPDGIKRKQTTTRKTHVEGDKTTITETIVIEEPEPPAEEEPPVANATVPDQFSTTPKKSALNVARVGELLYAAREGKISHDELYDKLKGQNAAEMFALSDIKYDGTGGLAGTLGMLPQWIGEVWNAVTYRQQILPLFSHADLQSLTINGFRWGQKAAGGDWAGNKADIPSNTLTASAVTATATRYAVGHDIAREFVDFNVPGFFESYAAAVGEDYARWADTKVATAVVAGATALTADALTTLPGPTGGTIGSAASAIIDGATVMVTNGYLPDFALVAPALWKQMAKQPKNNVLGYLNASLGLEEGSLDGFTIRPSAAVTAGKVLVGMKAAATVYELPGVPIRVDALDLARGGIDKAAFGYAGVMINDARGLQLVTAATS